MERAAAAVAKLEEKHAKLRAVPAAAIDERPNPMDHYAQLDRLVGEIAVAKEELSRQQSLLADIQVETAPWLEAYAASDRDAGPPSVDQTGRAGCG